MSRRFFGTDGIRGRVGTAPITPDFVMRLGFAAGRVLAGVAHADGHSRVLIGKDTRVSGYMLESALECGLSAAGIDVLLCGPLPTPGVAYLTRALRLQAGIVISASHNPFEDNGIKFFAADGGKLGDGVEAAIESELDRPMACRASRELGKARRIDDAQGRYIEFCKSTFPADLDLRGLRIVVDSAHGAAYQIAPNVLHELGADVISIGDRPNGFNINEGCGATAPDLLARTVLAERAHLGIALDGDADRLIMCDQHGVIHDGDQLLYVIVRDRHHESAVAGVAGTLMTNLALERALGSMGIAFERAKVGDRYVLELMQARGWMFGGENSGHILCLDRHTTGDGMVSALQVLAALVRGGQGLAEAAAPVALFPQRLINLRIDQPGALLEHPAVEAACAEVRATLGARGRILLRPSGTEPVLRVMVEGEDRAEVDALAEGLASTLRDLARARAE
jgi:phosphoglucosamine mutase